MINITAESIFYFAFFVLGIVIFGIFVIIFTYFSERQRRYQLKRA